MALDVSQLFNGWLNEIAVENNKLKYLILLTSQLFNGWLNAIAFENMPPIPAQKVIPEKPLWL